MQFSWAILVTHKFHIFKNLYVEPADGFEPTTC
jgi:hypothetical protein